MFSKTDNLGRESLSPAEVPCSFSGKETPLKERIRLLKQELALKEEQLFSLSKESCCMERCHDQKQKIATARSHAAGEESSISYSDMKGMRVGQFLRVCIMEVAADTRDNIRKVLHLFFGTIKNMQQPEFRLKSHNMKVSLNGDFKNLGLFLDHQGSGATYLSIKDEVVSSVSNCVSRECGTTGIAYHFRDCVKAL